VLSAASSSEDDDTVLVDKNQYQSAGKPIQLLDFPKLEQSRAKRGIWLQCFK
jgi:hypothetical protein